MLEPMGLPKDVSVIAWGISLERPTMIYYGIDNIRDLFGHKRNFMDSRNVTITDVNILQITQLDLKIADLERGR